MSLQSKKTVLALFSGGLDSVLAAKLIEEQGISVKCLHFYSPFFGNPVAVKHWAHTYSLDITAIDVSNKFVELLTERPAHNFGKVLNPCIDCKILLIDTAKKLMQQYNAVAIISGEVLGQRPMSQRREALNIIRKQAKAEDVLLRPLSAKLLPETPAETSGFIDRSRLLGLSGRGRKEHMVLAEHFKLKEIPSPAGGCLLTDKEAAARYWAILQYKPTPTANDFYLAAVGRQYWNTNYWLSVGRNHDDNEKFNTLLQPGDVLFKTVTVPGPLAIRRALDKNFELHDLAETASFVASFAPKAKQHTTITVAIKQITENNTEQLVQEVQVEAMRETSLDWTEQKWVDICEAVKNEQRERIHAKLDA